MQAINSDFRLKFRCYPGISCFTKCCSKVRIILSPYDIYRLKKRLNTSYDEFMHLYTTMQPLENTTLPLPILKIKDVESQECVFLTAEGCTVYEDRPVTCRYYPLGMALMRKDENIDGEDMYVLIKEDHCKGHQEKDEWSINEWRSDQQADYYDEINRDWMAIVLKVKTLGPVSFGEKSLHLFHMFTTDMDAFRKFVFESDFLKMYEIDEKMREEIRNDEEKLILFSQKWLRFTLFGEGDIKFREDAVGQKKSHSGEG